MTDFNTFNDTDSPENNNISDGVDPTIKASVSSNGDIGIADGLSNGGVNGNLVLTTANTAYEAKVGGSRLASRKMLTIIALDDMYWGLSNGVTTANGMILYKNQSITFAIDPTNSAFQVWLVAAGSSKNARIAEAP